MQKRIDSIRKTAKPRPKPKYDFMKVLIDGNVANVSRVSKKIGNVRWYRKWGNGQLPTNVIISESGLTLWKLGHAFGSNLRHPTATETDFYYWAEDANGKRKATPNEVKIYKKFFEK